MRMDRPPYWFWRIDRWNVLVAGFLALAALVLAWKGPAAPPRQAAVPTFSEPAAGARLTEGAPGGVAGTASPNTRLRLFEGDRLLGETVSDMNGTFRLALPPLAPGSHSLVLRAYDQDGAVIATSDPITITVLPLPQPTLPVQLTPQPLPTAGAPPLILALPQGELKPGPIAGTAVPGARVEILEGGTVVAETTAGADGTWQLTLPALAPGTHDLVARATAPDGTVTESAPVQVTVPLAPVPSTPTVAPSVSQPAPGGVVSDQQPLFVGRANPNDTVRIYEGESYLGEVQADADGNWSWRPVAALAPGEHTITLVVVGPDGQVVLRGEPITFRIEPWPAATATPAIGAAGPPAPVWLSPQPGTTLTDRHPLFIGTAAPGSLVRIYDGGVLLGETVADADGYWSLRLAVPLADGEHTLTAIPVDAEGKEGPATASLTVRIAAPVLLPEAVRPPILTSPLPPALPNSRPPLEGEAPPGATVRIYDGDRLIGTVTADESGKWYFVPERPLAPGEHALRLEVVTPEGTTAASPPIPLTIAPGAVPVVPPAIQRPAIGTLPAGGILSGTAPPGSNVLIYEDGQLIGTVAVARDGTWRLKLPSSLLPGPHRFRVVAINAKGVTIGRTGEVEVRITRP